MTDDCLRFATHRRSQALSPQCHFYAPPLIQQLSCLICALSVFSSVEFKSGDWLAGQEYCTLNVLVGFLIDFFRFLCHMMLVALLALTLCFLNSNLNSKALFIPKGAANYRTDSDAHTRFFHNKHNHSRHTERRIKTTYRKIKEMKEYKMHCL